MREVDQRQPLPKIFNKRVNTQGSNNNLKNYNRFSFQINEDRLKEYRNIYTSGQKDKHKMSKLYSQNHFPNKLQRTDPIKAIQRKRLHQIMEQKTQKESIQINQFIETDPQQKDALSNACKKFEFNNILLRTVQKFYFQDIKKRPLSHQEFPLFIDLLQESSSVFKKINPIVLQSLLKLGVIASYEPGNTIYRQGSPIKNLGIILWGETILKKNNSKFRFSCFPGCGIGEEILFQKITHTQARSSNIEKGKFLTYEKCKSSGTCGILFIGEKEYGWISEQLILQGMKQILMKFQSLLLRNYLKKKQKRLLFG